MTVSGFHGPRVEERWEPGDLEPDLSIDFHNRLPGGAPGGGDIARVVVRTESFRSGGMRPCGTNQFPGEKSPIGLEELKFTTFVLLQEKFLADRFGTVVLFEDHQIGFHRVAEEDQFGSRCAVTSENRDSLTPS